VKWLDSKKAASEDAAAKNKKHTHALPPSTGAKYPAIGLVTEASQNPLDL